jgi:hypothetical protein
MGVSWITDPKPIPAIAKGIFWDPEDGERVPNIYPREVRIKIRLTYMAVAENPS